MNRLINYRCNFVPSQIEMSLINTLNNLFDNYGFNKKECDENTKRILAEIFKIQEEHLAN